MSGQLKAVIYTDAGLTSSGMGSIVGYGIHGYTYIDEVPKTGTGNKEAKPTALGYEGPMDTRGTKIEGEAVTIVNYIDIIGSSRNAASSGQAELGAFIEALKWLDKEGSITEVIIYSDSKFVVDSANKYLSNWIRLNWKRSNGEDVKYKDQWKEYLALKEKLDSRMSIRIEWIKGHNGNIGNESADKLATRGKAASRNNKEGDIETHVSDAKGYWNPKVEVPRLLQAPRLYFETASREHIDEEGYTIYNVGAHGPKDKETALIGKPYTDNYLGVIKVKEPDPVIEKFRDYALKSPSGGHSKIVVLHTDPVLGSRVYSELDRYGIKYCQQSEKQILIKDYNGTVLMSEMFPQGQGYRMSNVWRIITSHIEAIRNQDKRFTLTDITDQLYETQGTKTKTVLKAKWTSRVKFFDVVVGIDLSTSKEKKPAFTKKVRILFGQDILSRNQLAALADSIERVSVVTWRDSDQVARYGVYIEMKNGDHGLWSRYEANLILCQDK